MLNYNRTLVDCKLKTVLNDKHNNDYQLKLQRIQRKKTITKFILFIIFLIILCLL
jgi:hypothetical protein